MRRKDKNKPYQNFVYNVIKGLENYLYQIKKELTQNSFKIK